MSQIEDEYQKRFKNQELPNSDFDSEGLWGEIAESLHEEQPSSNKHRMLFWFFFLVVMVGAIGTYFINHTIDQQIADNHARSGSNNEEESSVDLVPSNELDQTSLQPPSFARLDSTETIHSNSELAKSAVTSISSTPKALNYSAPESRGQTEPSDFLEPINSAENPTVPSNTQAAKNLKFSAIEPIEVSMVSPIAMLPVRLSFVKSDSLLQPILPLWNTESDNHLNVKSLAWQIGAWGGGNRTSFQYKSGSMSDLTQLKEQTERVGLGKSFGVSTSLLWENRWLLSTGIEYHQLWSTFEYKEEQPIQVNKENQLLRVWVDAATSDTLASEYGDATVNALAIRNVVNHNKYQRFSIPIGVGFQQTSAKVVYGVTASGLLSFTTSQSGKTLNEGAEIIDFDKNSTVAPFKAFNVGARVSPFLGYRISTGWTIKVNPQWTWQTGADFGGTEVKLNVHQFNLNFGVEYAFKLP